MIARFADNLKRLRAESGLSQRELAKRMYVTRSTISHWENGSRMPETAMTVRLAECLGTDVGALLAASATGVDAPCVILVDDRKAFLTGGLLVLEEAIPTATVVGFTRPAEALEFVRGNRVALAFLDIELGRESGLEVCRALLDVSPRTNVVFLTAYAEYALEAWKTGASGFIVKPITPEAVLDELGRLRHPLSLGVRGT